MSYKISSFKLSFVSIIFLALNIYSMSSYAQNVLTSQLNAPRDSDKLYKYRVEYTDPGNSGNNICWDFEKVNVLDKSYIVTFSCDSLHQLTCIENGSIYKYQLKQDLLMQTAYEDPKTSIKYDPPIMKQKYPFGIDMKISQMYHGKGVYCGNHNIDTKGNIEQEADGTGTIILSKSDTLKNVIRIHTISTYATAMAKDTCISDSIDKRQGIEETYSWYARGYRYPVYETISRTSYYNISPVACYQTAFMYLPENQRSIADSLNQRIASKDTLKSRTENNNQNIIKYTIKNNGGFINIDYDITQNAHITAIICDIYGILYKHVERNDNAGEKYTIQIDCNNLRRGQYILYLNVNGKIYSEKVNEK